MGDQTSQVKELERVFDDDSAEPINISYAAIQRITNNFSEKIGDGGFAVVYLGYLQNRKVAVKKFNRSYNYSDKQFTDEIACLLKVKHKNVVRFLGYCAETQHIVMEVGGKHRLVDDQRRLLCFEYVPNRSLDHFIKEKIHGFGCNTRYQIIKGICQGLKYLHDQRIYHLDLKPANVLLDDLMEPKITDFGLSRFISEQSTVVTESFFGTIGYVAPEFIANQQISPKSDIFSLGVIMVNVLIGCTGGIIDNAPNQVETGHLCILGNFESGPHDVDPRGAGNWWHEETLGISCPNLKTCIEIAQICVDTNPRNRPTIAEIIHKLNVKETMIETVCPRINEPRNDRGPSLGQAVQTFYAPSRQTLREYSRMEGEMDIVVDSSSKPCGTLEDYYIPDYVLKPGAEQVLVDHPPHYPVLVFINSRSSGQLGSSLIKTYRELLNEEQVFDISEEAPDKVLHRLYGNLERLKTEGDILAVQILRTLRLIVAGDDGTASWLLGVVSDLKLSHPPPIATVPLGTGNNLPFSNGWGKKNVHTDQDAVKSILGLVKHAREMKIDSWYILLRMRIPEEGPCDPVAPLELPHLLHAFHRVCSSDSLSMEGYHMFRGGFWNYFSMGIDAEVSYSERKKQLIYPGKVGRKKGWLFASRNRPSSWNIVQLAKVKVVKRPGGQWEELRIHHNIHSIVCLNLPSFSGGLNPWGTPSTRTLADRELTPPFIDDGLIEVVGFRDAWHGLALLAPNGHGTRLGQVHRIRFEFHKGAADHTFMRVDGEPWKQPLPKDDDTLVVEISHVGQAIVLVNDPCRSKSFMDPCSPSPFMTHDKYSDDADDENEWEFGERKFGAADSFKIPDEIDIAHLS